MVFLLILASLILLVLLIALVMALRDPDRDIPFLRRYVSELWYILFTVVLNSFLFLIEGVVHFFLWCEELPARIRNLFAASRKHR